MKKLTTPKPLETTFGRAVWWTGMGLSILVISYLGYDVWERRQWYIRRRGSLDDVK